MVGSALVRALASENDQQILTQDRQSLDLESQGKVNDFFSKNRIDEIYLAAAKVGGIHANSSLPADFLYKNLVIATNVINAAFCSGVKKILFLGSSCIYPKHAPQPITEEALLTGPLESTNEPYAISKIAGIKLCESLSRQFGDSHGIDYRAVMPTNLYGPGDNYHLENAHVIPALIRKFQNAKTNREPSVSVWGSGKPMREFLHVDDLAAACKHLMQLDRQTYLSCLTPNSVHVNVGYGKDISIAELSALIAEVVGYQGKIVFDPSMPDGTPRKLLDVSKINTMGWKATIGLKEGLEKTVKSYLRAENKVREHE